MTDQTSAPLDPYVPGSGTVDFTVSHYDLGLEVKLAANRLSGRARLTGTALLETSRIELDLHGLSAGRVTVRTGSGKASTARSTHRGDRLGIDLGSRVPAGTELTVDVPYSGVPSLLQGQWGEVGWEELTDGVLVAGQPNGAQTWFPCVDHPSVKSTYTLTVSTDAGYLPVCNGVPAGHRRRSSREEWTWELTEPAPSYLVTLQIGRYRLEALPGSGGADRPDAGPGTGAGTAPVFVAAPPALADRSRSALGVQTAMMDCLAAHFGPYPFDRYTAVVTEDPLEIPLEAASLSIFGVNHLDGTWESERLIAHELSHQWFGNALTLGLWKDIWLHEGFACFSEWIWSEESGQASMRIQARRAWRGLALKRHDLVVADPGPELMFDDRLYKRGALALYALRCAVGPEVFGRTLRTWVAANLHGTVDTARFLAHADEAAAKAGHADGLASRVLAPWLFEAALPGFPGADGPEDEAHPET